MAPKQKPGLSKQDYCTPPEFLAALKRRLCIKRFWCDLAASKDNAVAEWFYTEEDNSLLQCWNSEECNYFIPKWDAGEWAFCNPPFAKIKPWVFKASMEAMYGAQVAILVPAAVGSNWWKHWVHDNAHVLFLNGRLSFIPDKPKWLYPKDCAILLYTPHSRGGYEVWNWREHAKDQMADRVPANI